MADQRIRELERAAAAGGPEARGRLLAERLRIGELEHDVILLAQHLGCPAARAVEGIGGDPPPPLRDALEALEARSPTLVVRALIAGGAVLMPVYRTWLPTEERCDQALRAARAWLDAPSPELGQAAWDAAIDAQGAINNTTYTMVGRWRVGMISRDQMSTLEYVARTAHDAADGAFRVEADDGRPQTSSLLRLEETGRLGGWLDAETIREAIQAEVVPILLG